MRTDILLALTGLILSSGHVGADEKAQAIPQDPEKQAQFYRDTLVWNRKSLGEAYEKVGKKDPRWDKPAREALDAAARHFSRDLPTTKAEEVFDPAKKAIESGCDDPLILYLYARLSVKGNFPGQAEYASRCAKAAKAMESSAYSPYRRATTLYRAAWELLATPDVSPENRKEAMRLIDGALALLPKIMKEDERNPDTEYFWFELPQTAIMCHQKLSGDDEAAFKKVDEFMSSDPAWKALRLKVKGDFYVRWAWKARGDGLADTVTEDGWKKFGERLKEARKALEESWSLNPGDGRVATIMLTVEKGIGGNRDEMEKWFGRAMKADGNNKEACIAKMDWLDPKWNGTIEDMMAFGKACRDSKNWRAGITVLLVDAYTRALSHMPKDERQEYISSPEVRREIKAVFDDYLQHIPLDNRERSRYAAFCYMTNQHAEADRQFQILGDDLIYVFDEAYMKRAKAAVAGKSGQKPAEKKPVVKD
jgi:hypothetical protein